MKDLEKEKLERIERRLLKAHRISADELRALVSEPQFFDKIDARIKAEQAVRNSPGDSRKRTIFPLFNWQKIGLAFGGLTVFLAVILSLMFFARQDFSTAQLFESVTLPEIQKTIDYVDEPQAAEIREGREAENNVRNKPERIAFKNKASRFKAKTDSSRKPARTVRNEDEEVFYPLTFAENLEEAKENGKVVRVELSRSSLLALGLNPPMDDEVLKVKTDLLIGSDGVARGIRFVK